MPDYGRLIGAPTVERGAARSLGLWLPGYLGDALVQAGLDRFGLPTPTNTVRVVDTRSWPWTENLAVAVIAASRADAEPQGGGMYSMTWELTAGVATTYGDDTATREAAQFYALGSFCLAHKGLEGVPDAAVQFRGEVYEALAATDERTLMFGGALFWVHVPDARAMYGGPDEPPPAPGERPEGTPGQTVQSVNVDTDKLDG